MSATRTRIGVRVTGVVQGVGFRPFVHRVARELGLNGHVGNDSAGVFIDVAGPDTAVEAFLTRLRADAPPLARIEEVRISVREPSGVGEREPGGFRIVDSPAGGVVATSVPPDVGICDDCRRELFDPTDRRHRHPFITCTNCGPRFTITRALPYDRPTTTMADFPLCTTCDREYHDPTDRRFHAQPIACHDCGPRLRYEPTAPDRTPVLGTEPALAAVRAALHAGGTVAVKGVGGFHLACDATSRSAVARLRHRKHRPHKPFPVMVADLATARSLVALEPGEAAALTSPQRPVVLARRRSESPATGSVAEEVAPGNPLLGVMLPSSPLHELLLAPAPDGVAPPVVLVMTSGNLSGEPICYRDEDVHSRLGPLVDGVLTHDRPIHVPCDDGVVRAIDGVCVPVRRSRGDAPLPLRLPVLAGPSLATGAELKNTVGVASGRQVWLSQHIGDLGDLETLTAFERATTQLTEFFQVIPEVVVADPHPAYTAHAWARRNHRGKLTTVQHHHAHAAALLAEHDWPADEPVLAVAFDGTGYGEDGTVWGGELLLADLRQSRRVGHLVPVPLPGGDSAVTNPARMALSHLWAAGLSWEPDLPCVAAVEAAARSRLQRQLERGLACVPTSSMGRLFDAVSSLLGVCHAITYEGQAAIELEWLADAFTAGGGSDGDAPALALPVRRPGEGAPMLLDPGPLLDALIRQQRDGVDRTALAASFHLAVARAVVEVAANVAADGGPSTVGLTGGVFQNAWLATRTRSGLLAAGLEVLTHRLVPANDGGLAYGQLAVAAARRHADEIATITPT